MLRLPHPHKVQLSSGATFLHQTNPFSPTIAFGVWIAGGSSGEGTSERGLSHLLEHVVFRGTKNRDALRIAYDLESIGGQWDAFTGKEATVYHGKVLEEHFEALVDILADIICRPSIPEKTFRLEKKVIQEEIRSINDSPEELVHELFFATLFKGHPLAHPVAGCLGDVARYTRDDLIAFHANAYTARNTYIGFVGNIPLPKVVSIVEKKFRFPKKGLRVKERVPGEVGTRVRSLRRAEWVQAHVCIGARTIAASHRDRYALIILTNVLGGGVTSRLFQALREKTGLVYSVDSHSSFWREAGALCNFFSVDSKNLERALDIFHAELRELRESGAREDEIKSAKAQIEGSLVFGAESIENRLFNLVQSEYYYGRHVQCGEIVKAIEKVDRTSVTKAAREYLADDRLLYASCGPVGLKGLAP